jgi:hypothetical protein
VGAALKKGRQQNKNERRGKGACAHTHHGTAGAALATSSRPHTTSRRGKEACAHTHHGTAGAALVTRDALASPDITP